MKIGLILYSLSDRQLTYKGAVALFKKAARERGHQIKVLVADGCEFVISSEGLNLYYEGKPFPKVDCIIPRVGISKKLELELLLNKQLLLMGYTVLNDYLPFARAKNKIRTLQILSEAKMPMPKTIVIKNLENLDHAVQLVGGFPTIVKLPVGSQGKGVAIVETRRSLLSSVGMMMSQGVSSIILQEYVEEANGKDLRVFVVNGKVVAAMERTAAEGDFRSNIFQGGQGNLVILSKKEKEVAIKSAKLLGLDVAGVDLLRSKNGPVVMEVNSNPGLAGITQVSGLDVAGEIIDFLVAKTLKNRKNKKTRS